MEAAGLYVWGHEVRAITFCGDEQNTYWVRDETDSLRTAYEALQLETPYAEAFVRVRGRFEPNAADGFAADFDGVFVVEDLVSMSRPSAEANCARPAVP